MKLSFWKSVSGGALLLGLSSLISRFLGVFRDYVFSKQFGIGEDGGVDALDAYFVAFRIPDLLYALLIFGAMSVAFIPLYTRYKKEGEAEASRFASLVLTNLLVLLLILCGVCFILAPHFVPLLAPGFEGELFDITVDLTRIMLLSPIFMGLSSILQGIENAHRRFTGMALAPVVYNLTIILGAILFADSFGVYGIAWAVAVGAFLHFLVQVPGALRTSFKFRPQLRLLDPRFKELVLFTVPRFFGLAASQTALLIDTILASLLPLGSLSVYTYAFNLQSLPLGVVAISFATVLFPVLSEQAHEKDKTEFLRTLRSSLTSILFWVIPATIGLFILREPVVNFILLGGEFDPKAAAATSFTLAFFVWTAIPQSFLPLLIRAFFALGDTKITIGIAFFSMGLNAFLSFFFTQVQDMPVYGLALASVISFTIYSSLLLIFLSKLLRASIAQFFDFKNLALIVLSSLVMALFLSFFNGTLNLPIVFQLFSLVAVGGLVYLGLNYQFGVPVIKKS